MAIGALRKTAALIATGATASAMVAAWPVAAQAAPNDKPVRSWAVPGSLNSRLAVDARNGEVYFADRVGGRIHRYAPSGKPLGSPWANSADHLPTDLSVTASGAVVVLERGRSGSYADQVGTYSATGALVGVFEVEGHVRFGGPESVAVAPNGDIYLAGEADVVHYSANGTELGGWTDVDGIVNTISGIAVAPSGEVYVSDAGDHDVKRFSATGQPLGRWGSYGNGVDQLISPSAVAVDPQGRVAVADPGPASAAHNRVQMFSATGTHLGTVGGPKSIEHTPEAVGLDAAGRVFVYDDGHHWGTHVRVFQPGPQIAAKKISVKGRTAKVRLSCTKVSGRCQGRLLLKQGKRTLAKGTFKVKAGKTKSVKVKLTRKGKRAFSTKRPRKITVVANPKGGQKVTKKVRVRRG